MNISHYCWAHSLVRDVGVVGDKKSAYTFCKTDSLNFSRLMILMATFFPATQWTPSLTKPANDDAKQMVKSQYFSRRSYKNGVV